MLEFDTISWLIIIAAAISIGFSKTTSISSLIIFIPLLAAVMPARSSVGFVLPMLCLADVIAIIYWRHHVHWSSLLRLMPWALLGIAIGYYWLSRISDKLLMLIIGLIILSLLAVTIWRNIRYRDHSAVPTS